MTETAKGAEVFEMVERLDPATWGVEELFEHKWQVAFVLQRSDAVFERLLSKWTRQGVPRLDVFERAVRRNISRAERTMAERQKVKSSLATIANDDDEYGQWPRRLGYSSKFGDDAANAELFLGARPHKLITSADTLYSLNDSGIWKEAPIAALRAEVRQTDPQHTLGANSLGAMIQSTKDVTYTPTVPFEWVSAADDAPAPHDAVLFRNGLLNLHTRVLLPLDGSYFATGTPDYDFDPDAKCERWLEWLSERLEESFIATLQEWMGFAMVPDVRAQRFMSFIGKSRSGKGTAKTVLEGLVGASNVASMVTADLASRFGLWGAIDKLLAIFPDAKDAAAAVRAQALERLLAITGGDTIGIDRKNKSAVNVKLSARVLILGNAPLHWIDESGALAARQIMVKFDRSFIGKEDQRVGDALIAELPGIANWALEGLRRLRQNDYHFTVGTEGRAAVEKVRLAGSPALRFAEECLVVTGTAKDFVLLDSVYSAYEDWARREGLGGRQWRNKTDLGGDLETALDGVKVSQPRGLTPPKGWVRGSYRPRVVRGVSGLKRVDDDS